MEGKGAVEAAGRIAGLTTVAEYAVRQRGRSSPRQHTASHEAAAHICNSTRWTVALALGLRQSEALALQWKDVDLLNNTLTVRRSIHRIRDGGLV